MEFWSQAGTVLAGSRNVYLFLAVVGSVFFVFQLIMTLAGGGMDHDADGGFELQDHVEWDLSGLKLLSVKGIASFITFFGWAGFFWGSRGWAGLLLAFGCGFLMMFLTALSLWLLLKLQQSGNVASQDCVGCRGTVYLAIPAGRKPGGQVTIALPGGTRQSRVVADLAIPRGETVKILEVLAPDLFLVARSDMEPQQGEK